VTFPWEVVAHQGARAVADRSDPGGQKSRTSSCDSSSVDRIRVIGPPSTLPDATPGRGLCALVISSNAGVLRWARRAERRLPGILRCEHRGQSGVLKPSAPEPSGTPLPRLRRVLPRRRGGENWYLACLPQLLRTSNACIAKSTVARWPSWSATSVTSTSPRKLARTRSPRLCNGGSQAGCPRVLRGG